MKIHTMPESRSQIKDEIVIARGKLNADQGLLGIISSWGRFSNGQGSSATLEAMERCSLMLTDLRAYGTYLDSGPV